MVPTLEIICQGVPGRLNEDAWIAMQTGPLAERTIFAAIDGATTRLTPPKLQHYLDRLPDPLTPAAFAARTVRDSLARQVGAGMPPDLRTLFLEANADLGRALIGLLGALTLDALGLPAEIHADLAHDPRLVRLGLPACVMTLAEYDPVGHMLRWAHAGDSLLLVGYRDGTAAVPTRPADQLSDHELLRAVFRERHHRPALSFREAAAQSSVRRTNLHNALYHNFVDEHGLPQPGQGIGVLDGLPDLRYFVQSGHVSLSGAAFVCAMSDGLEWPASAHEVLATTPEEAAVQRDMRLASMVETIRKHGLAGYLARLRDAEALDPDHERYPRLKTHDDATGVLLRFE